MTLSSNGLLERLKALPAAGRAHVALSGGLDSCVLLHLLVSIRQQLPWSLNAIHINHGLQEQAADFQNHCQALCDGYQLPLEIVHLNLSPTPGESLEAVAREARYAAIASLMGEGDLLLTAQHQDDQAETLLLQLLRGSGPAGLAAMPTVSQLGPGRMARPLLEFSRESLEDYARAHQLEWMDDPSNQDRRFDRNFLRHEVMPLLRSRWPSASQTFARAARFSGELLSMAEEEANRDLAGVLLSDSDELSIQALKDLSSVRQRNLLRHWIAQQGASTPHSKKLARIESEVVNGRSDSNPEVVWDGWQVRRYRDRLILSMEDDQIPPPVVLPWKDKQQLLLPDGLGRLYIEPDSEGVSARQWREAKVEVRFRGGGGAVSTGRSGPPPFSEKALSGVGCSSLGKIESTLDLSGWRAGRGAWETHLSALCGQGGRRGREYSLERIN